MLFSYNWLQSFFQRKLPSPNKLADFLMMHTLEVEEIEKINSDWVLNIDVLSNRLPDCSSHLGIAREISAILGYKLKPKVYSLKEDRVLKTKEFLEVLVKDRNLCRRYCARVVEGVKVRPSPKWLKEKLIACGLQSINNIVDIANYIMLETGQPLHAFDYDKLFGNEDKKTIITRLAKSNEKITTLENKEYNLDKNILVIADRKNPIAIAGIKGGKKAEIDKNTKKIVLESANFDGVSIYKTSKKLKLQTDASTRFSSNIDPNLAEDAINRAAVLIQEIAGGNILEGIVDFYPKKVLSARVKLNLDHLRSILGVDIPENEVKKILQDLGFEVKKQAAKNISVKIPTFRRDISIEEDLIEEVGRIFGYENISSELSTLQKNLPEKNKALLLIDKIRQEMRGFGFVENYNYSFISEEDARFFTENGKRNLRLLETLNPISSNIKYIRFSLIPNILKAIKLNKKRFENIKFFEFGNVYQNSEKRNFAGVIMGEEKFYELKGFLDVLFEELRIFDVSYRRFNKKNIFWKSTSLAEIKAENKDLGLIGEISKKARDFYQIQEPIFAFELDFKTILSLSKEKKEYEPIPLYPATTRDISVVVPKNILANSIIRKIKDVGGDLIKNIEIFDVYDLSEKDKNLSFHVVFRARDKTLNSKEVDEIQEKIIKEIEKESGWQVRR